MGHIYYDDNDHPTTVYYGGVEYDVSVSRGRGGEIESFSLSGPEGEFFIEGDWAGPLDTEDVLDLIQEYGD